MGTKKAETEVEEITILTEEQVDALPKEAVTMVRSLRGSLPNAQLQIFIPVVQKYMELREKASNLKLIRDEELEITKESIDLYKEVKAEQRTFNGMLKREIKKIKDPLNAIKNDVLTVEKTFQAESDKIKIAAENEFEEYEDELEKVKQAALDKKNAAMNDQIDKANQEADRLRKQSQKGEVYNKIKYIHIQEEITNTVDDAIFQNNEDTLAALKAHVAQKTFEGITAKEEILLLDDETLKELEEGFLKAKERAIFKLDQKFEEYERKRLEYAESKVKEVIPPPPLPSLQVGAIIPDNVPIGTNDEEFIRKVEEQLNDIKFSLQARLKAGSKSLDVNYYYNRLFEIIKNR